MDLRDLFAEVDPAAAVGIVDAIADHMPTSDRTIEVLDELDAIVADKLLAVALEN